MLSVNGAVKWVGENPLLAGGAIFVLGLGALWATGFFSSSTGQDNSAGLAQAESAAVSQDDASNAAIVTNQQNNTAAEAIAQINADAYTETQHTWADNALAITTSNNNAAMAAAPYYEDAAVISTLGSLAALPGTQTTSKSNGFFGIGGGTKVTTTPNPVASSAASALLSYVNSGHLAMNG